MKYSIVHTTRYAYESSVAISHNLAFLQPRSTDRQKCVKSRLVIRPDADFVVDRTDFFGNTETSFSVSSSHKQLEVTSRCEVELSPAPEFAPADSDGWETVQQQVELDRSGVHFQNYQFIFPSPQVCFLDGLTAYARESFVPGRPILEAVIELNHRIHQDITYDPRATTVSTPVSEVFQNRRGVCQDLAHLMIAAIRSLGLPARYVSGYLRTHSPPGKPRLVGADASHAWLSVYCGDAGWVDVDPTNDTLVQLDHITLAWGRDFSDVCPISGMFTGGGTHQLHVAVDVEVSG